MEMISVIIPVYKTERYLCQCVESVLAQSWPFVQIILIDDGSPDRCGEICDHYAKTYGKISVIHQKNGGLSAARNTGIKHASGDYIVFLDSDDYWDDESFLKHLMEEQHEQDADVLNFHYKLYFEKQSRFVKNMPQVSLGEFLELKTKEEQFCYLIKTNNYIASACNKLIRTGLFYNNDLFFKEGLLSEDVEWCARLAIAAQKFGVSGVDAYVYRQRTGSITHSLDMNNLDDLAKSIQRCISYRKGTDAKFLKAYFNYVAYQYAVFFVSAGYVKNRQKQLLYSKMRKYSYLLKYDISPKVHKMHMLYKLMGYKGICTAGILYARIRG